MSRNLLILRHAKSDWDTDATNDFERPLAKRGERDAPRIGQWLKRQKLLPNHVVSSPAQRARQTSETACKAMGIKETQINWDERIYAATEGELLKVLADCPKKKKTVMLVGHNPGLEDLVAYLAGAGLEIPADGKVLPTAAVAHLKMPENWTDLKEGDGQLVSIKRPKDIT